MDTNQQNKVIAKIVLRHIFLIAVIITVVIVYDLTGIGCPIRKLTGLPCPSCGMTRAVYAMARLDFTAAAKYNPLTLPIIAAILLGLHRHLFKYKRLVDIIVITTAIVVFGFYIYNTFLK